MIVSSTLAIILFNTLFLIILNKNSYASKSIRPQPRIIFTTLALNDLANGLLVLGVGIIPATFQCWPFGEFLCQIQVRQFNCYVCFKKNCHRVQQYITTALCDSFFETDVSTSQYPKPPRNLFFSFFYQSPNVLDFNEKRLHWVSSVRGTSHLIFPLHIVL